jgi:hypothetical protein
MKNETKEMKTIKEMKKIDENVSDYIDNTLDFLMKYGMSEQEASISIIKQFKRVLSMEKK